MNLRHLASALALVALTVVATAMIATQEEKKPQDETPSGQMSKEDMMKKWTEANALTSHHAALSSFAGEWVAHATRYDADGSVEGKSVDAATNSVILDGRILMLEYEGDWEGKPFHGLGFTGYDTVRKEHYTVWFDNFSTGPMIARGKAQESDDVVRVVAEQINPVDGMPYQEELVTTIVSDDEHRLDMYMTSHGHRMHQMKVEYERKK